MKNPYVFFIILGIIAIIFTGIMICFISGAVPVPDFLKSFIDWLSELAQPL